MDFSITINQFEPVKLFKYDKNFIITVAYISYIFLAAEFAISKENEAPWLTELKLDKRRAVNEFDRHLQQMILYIGNICDYSAYCIECGNKSLYKTELRNANGYCLHFNHSFDYNAKYNKKYLESNDDIYNPKFAYFSYQLNSSKNNVTSLKLIVPSNYSKDTIYECDFSNALNNMRKTLLNNADPMYILEQLKSKKTIEF